MKNFTCFREHFNNRCYVVKKQLLILFTLLMASIGYSQTFTENFITYQVISSANNTVRTQDYNQAGGTVVNIPASVTDTASGNTYTVTEIGIDSFFNKQLTSVTIPNSVQFIINFAFGTNQLTTITIPDSVVSIGGNAFVNNQLNSITLSNGLTAIGLAAFATNQLTNVTIPDSVNSIAAQAFNNNPLNSVISLATVPPVITSGSGDSFGNHSVIDLTVPAGTIGDYAASTWTGFNSVTEASALAVGDTFIIDYITYEIISLVPDMVEVIDYDIINGGTSVVIPATVMHNSNTYDVTEIGDNAFNNKGIDSVSIPGSITNIGISAFELNNLTDVIVPDSVTVLGTTAFATNSIVNLNIGENVSIIGIGAFVDNSLANVTLPSSVTEIGLLGFGNNPLTSVTSLAATPPTITTGTNDTFAFDRSGIDLYIAPGATAVYAASQWIGFNSVTEELIVGDTYTTDFITYQITSTANNTAMVTDYDEVNGGIVLDIPSTINNGLITYSVTSIGNTSLINKGLTGVIFPDSLISIGQQSLSNNNLISIDIPDGVITIAQGAFTGNQLTNIVFPNSITDVGDSAFQSNNIVSVVFSSNMTSIGNNVFTTNNLSTLTIPDNITSVGIGAFQGNQLTSVDFGNTLEIIDIGAFADNQLTSIVLPSTVTTIENVAFRNNQLTTLTFPDSVTTIGLLAFENNPMTDVYSESTTPPTISTGGTTDSFANDRSNIHLHIPPGTMDVYVTNPGALWTGFNPVTEDASLSTSDFELVNDIKVITTSSEIKVITSNTVRLENYTIYSISGAKIKEGTESTIGIDAISNGIYIIELNFDKGTLVKKVVLY
ncbi:leucine-rich repeat domain-containing protein [Winogradskyella flava]|uniref:Leucine-rich repeat domain-containing protein n=1 Tax=Winogradskyella flava TaxID=1884876 RepID=A0A842IV74_9FLAO|nr:leucine-rich repeat domain-containing protein [Winogradskyella flava]MBC2846029.1 leucine-rich repeat domain-containing protein [Winogradskyella flava]